jgi:hypothetical protein
VPFACDRFEGIAGCNLRGPFSLTFQDGRIDIGSEVPLGFIARGARFHQPNGWIDAECKRALFAVPPKGQAPVLGSIRID